MSQAQITVEELGATRRRLDVEVPVEEVTEEIERAFGRVQREAHIKGFRPGRVPRPVLERYFGERVRADVLSHLIEHSYSDAVTRSGLRPVGPPEIVPENVEAGRPLRYSATVDIWPELELRDYLEMPAQKPVREVGEEEVDAAVEQLRESLAELRPVEGRETVEAGDFVALDYVVSIEGKPLPDSKRENRLVEVGKGAVPAEIEEGLRGMRTGETKPLDVAFPEDHGDAQVAGKTVRFDVTVRGLREKVVPPADDDLAKEHGECATLEELRGKLRQRIEASVAEEANSAVREQLLDELLRRNPFEAPQSLIERQTESLIEDLFNRLGPQAGALREDRERLEKIHADLRPRAERQVRCLLALDGIARQESIEVPEAEVDARIEAIAAQLGERAAQLRSAYREPAARSELRQRMAREQALERLIASAHVEEVPAQTGVVAPSPEKR